MISLEKITGIIVPPDATTKFNSNNRNCCLLVSVLVFFKQQKQLKLFKHQVTFQSEFQRRQILMKHVHLSR